MERETTNRTTSSRQGGQTGASVKKILLLLLKNWYWFLLSTLIALTCAFFYIKKTPPVYSRTTSLLIKQVEKNSTEALLQDMGVGNSPVNLTNEILSMTTEMVASEVVRRLDLDVDYFREGRFYDPTVYGVDLPVKVVFDQMNDRETASLSLDLSSDGKVRIYNLKRNDKDCSDAYTFALGDTVHTMQGDIIVLKSPYYKEGRDYSLKVVRTSIPSAVSNVRSHLYARLKDRSASIINVSYRDVSPARAVDILNTVVQVYNENWIADRNKRIISANEFIRDRLEVIEDELGEVDQDISSYKSENLMVDVHQSGSMAVSRADAAEQRSTDLSNQLYMLRYVLNYLETNGENYQLIPFNTGFTNAQIGARIAEYNNLLIQRNNHLANSSLQNPLIADLDKNLAVVRNGILQSIESEITLLQMQQKMIESTRSQAVSNIASNPRQAKYLLSVERKQRVKEQLYLFLLQKREENELSQAFTDYNTQLIEKPYGSSNPVEPVAKSIFLFALLLGLGIPAVIIFGSEFLKTTVQGRDDIKDLKAPLVGEIPQLPKKNRTSELLVKEKNRDTINEAFRVIRANLEFMSGVDETSHVIMLTSFNPGSGKTFISANLSEVFAIKGKKVLAVDLDLRRASLSAYVNKPKKGVVNYLSGREASWENHIVKLDKVDMLPCGSIPPNPTELLYSPRLEQLINEARDKYDFIFLDCPPIELMADAAIVNRHVDQTLFVIRAQVLEKALLPELDELYEEKKYKNMSLILNGSTTYGNRYGYGYGYSHYGHYGHYGYGYYSKEPVSEE